MYNIIRLGINYVTLHYMKICAPECLNRSIKSRDFSQTSPSLYNYSITTLVAKACRGVPGIWQGRGPRIFFSDL